ncbi:MAG: triose-phosphate isomerase [Corynebacterium sp.]|nr:triose-phosphate isomerase [Corynebacterium sp.]
MSRTPLIAGNWKMNLNHKEAIGQLQKFAFALPKEYYDAVEVSFMVPFTDIRTAQTLVEGDKLKFSYGAQDLSAHESGAYTGEISGDMLSALGCSYVVVGHSERRQYHGETNELVAAKAVAALKHSIVPIVCVGEPLDVRQAGNHVDYVVEQTRLSLADVDAKSLHNVVIAYEPVWAIGTGKVASAEDAQEVCAVIRELIAQLADASVAESIRILYGGSVKTDTVGELLSKPDVDGGLIGGASLQGEEFAKLTAAAAQATRK